MDTDVDRTNPRTIQAAHGVAAAGTRRPAQAVASGSA